MSASTVLWLRSAAKKSLTSTTSRLCKTSTSASTTPAFASQNFFSTASSYEDQKHHAIPEPALALAYDYYDDDDEHDSSSSFHNKYPEIPVKGGFGSDVNSRTYVTSVLPSANETLHTTTNLQQQNNLGTNSSSFVTTTTTTSASSSSIKSRKSFSSGGGGGGGRNRCPKCGTHVTFRHGDFEENTFYCATCSGWFLTAPTVGAGDGTSLDTGNVGDILMQHVSMLLTCCDSDLPDCHHQEQIPDTFLLYRFPKATLPEADVPLSQKPVTMESP